MTLYEYEFVAAERPQAANKSLHSGMLGHCDFPVEQTTMCGDHPGSAHDVVSLCTDAMRVAIVQPPGGRSRFELSQTENNRSKWRRIG